MTFKRLAMKRYFFDAVGEQRREYDYCGRHLKTAEGAFQLAELIALDYAVKGEDEWVGCSINVRDAEGQKLFSVPIQSSFLVAA